MGEIEWGEAVSEEFRQRLISIVANQTMLGGGSSSADFDMDDVFIFGANPDEALGAAMQKQMSAGGMGDARGRALGLIKAADALAITDKIDEATHQATEAAEICGELKSGELQAAAMNVMTKIHIKRAIASGDDEDFQLAQESATDTVRLFQKMGYRLGEGIALATYSSVFFAWGKAEKCIEKAKQALVIFSEIGAQQCMAAAYHALCNGYLLNMQTARAVNTINKASKIHETLGNKATQARCLLTIARLELIGNDPEKAKATMEVASKIYAEAGDTKGVGEVLDTTIDFAADQQKYGEAVTASKKKVNTYHNSGDTKSEAYALVQLGEILLTSSEAAKAEKVAEVALGMFAGMNEMAGMKAAKELLDGSKHAKAVAEIENTIERNREFMHVPDILVVDPGMNKRIASRFQEIAGK